MPVVRELVALFGFKTDKKSVETVDQQVGAFFDKLKGLAAVAGAAAGWVMLKGVAESVGRLGNEVETTAKRLGIGTQALQELTYAADQADVSREELTAGLKTLSNVAYEASDGGKQAGETMAKLGVRLRDAEGKLRPIEELFLDAADGLQKIESTTARAAIAQRAFGKSGLALAPVLAQGADGLKKMRERAHELGVVMDSELLDRTREWDDSTKDVNAAITGLKNVVGRALLPRLTALNKIWIRLLVGNRKLIHSGLERNLDRLGQVVENVVDFFATLTERVTSFLSTLSPLQKGLLTVSAIALALAGILLLPGGSLLVLIGLIGLMIDDFEVWRKGGKSVIGDLIGSMDDFKASFPGVSTAAGAFWESLKRIGSGIVSLVKGISELFGSLALFLVNVWGDPELATKDFIGNIKTLWSDFVGWLRDTIGVGAVQSITDAFQVVLDVFQRLEEMRERVVGGVGSVLKAMASSRGLLGALGFGGDGGGGATGTWAGGATGAWATGRGPVNSSIEQSNKVDINVNVAGGQNPEAIGQAVAGPVENAMERQLRNAMLDLTQAAPAGEF